jgi:alkylation response protein AidB-like acyl-CoA dehydrogenase
VAKNAVEVHGGMGFTELSGLHYWFKRIGANRQLLGNPARCRAQAAEQELT